MQQLTNRIDWDTLGPLLLGVAGIMVILYFWSSTHPTLTSFLILVISVLVGVAPWALPALRQLRGRDS